MNRSWKTARGAVLVLLSALLSAQGAGAICLDWPLGRETDGERVPGYGIYVMQNYNNVSAGWYDGRPHAGVDLAYSGGTNVGAPVYAAADGTVVYAAFVNYPGWVVLIEHDVPNGPIYTQYGHIGSVTVSEGDPVTKGSLLGTLWDQGSNTHLHFEVRTFRWDPINGSQAGPGYSSKGVHPSAQGWLDPVAYNYENRTAFPHTIYLTANRNVRSSPTVGASLLYELPAGPVVAEAVVPDTYDAGRWWYKVRYNGHDTGYVNGFWHNGWQSSIYFGEAARLCGQVLPGILNASGWDTNVYVRNLRSSSNTVTVTLRHPDGSVSGSPHVLTLGDNDSWRLSFGDWIDGGTAVVTADYGDDIVAVARIQRSNTDGDNAYAAFEGVDLPLAEQRIPVVHHNNSGWYNRIFFYNPDTERTARAWLSFSGASACNRNVWIAPLDTVELDTYSETCMADGWVGRIHVSTVFDGTTEPAPLAVTSLQEDRAGSVTESLMATAISRPRGETLYIPLIQNNNAGYLAGLAADSPSSGGGLQLTYREDNGAYCTTDWFSGWPLIHNPLPATANSCETILASVADATGGASSIFAQVNQLKAKDASSYAAAVHPAQVVHLPLLEGGTGVFRGISIQNTEPASVSVTVHFYDDAGALVASRTQTVAANGFWVLNGDHASGDIPPAARNAEVVAQRNLAVTVNHLLPGGGRDKVMDYTAAGRP